MDDSTTKPGAHEHQTHSERGGHSLGSIWAFLLLLVLYPLSIGPAAKIHQMHPAARPAIETAYQPLTSLMADSKSIGKFLVWYIENVWKVNPNPRATPAAPQTNSAAASSKWIPYNSHPSSCQFVKFVSRSALNPQISPIN